MIRDLLLLNFQAHKDSQLEFDEGVNVIVGQSDQGKSSIIRALRWLATNKPAGDAFRSHFAGKAEPTVVQATLEDPASTEIVQRVRDSKNNFYRLNSAEELKALKGSVPPDVEAAINMPPLNWKGSQHEGPFMLDMTAGQVAAYLNKIANLDQIDKSLANVSKKMRSNSQEVKHTADELEEAKEGLSKYKGLDKLEEDFEELEGLEQELDDTEQEMDAIKGIIQSLESIEYAISEYQDKSELLSIIDEIEKKEEKKDLVAFAIDDLEGFIRQIKRADDEIKMADDDIESLEQELKELEKQVCPTCGRLPE